MKIINAYRKDSTTIALLLFLRKFDNNDITLQDNNSFMVIAPESNKLFKPCKPSNKSCSILL